MISINMGRHYDAEFLAAGRKAFQIRFDVLLKGFGVPTVDQHSE